MTDTILLHTLLDEFQLELNKTTGNTVRASHFSPLRNKIKVAIGMRRTGKTQFLFQEIRHLQQQGIPLTQILYLNFEDDRLLPMDQKKMRSLIDVFYAIRPENHEKECYFFFDEIQQVEGWPLITRRLFDSKRVHIYLSGSSAKLLSKEIASSLRGRSMATEIWPYDFREYLTASHLSLPNKTKGQAAWDKLMKYLSDYLEQGGFPETVGATLPERMRLLQDYVNVVIFRDIIERHNITGISLIKYMIKTLLKNVASPFSVNKFYNDIKSQGLAVSKTTLHDYLNYIEDAYLAFTVPLHTESLRKAHTNPRKIYAVDTGLVHAYTTSFSNNDGRLFENLVYLELRRRGYDISYYLTQERYEVDFFAIDNTGHPHLYQVVWDISQPDTLARETRALKAAEKELGVPGKIITPAEYFDWYGI